MNREEKTDKSKNRASLRELKRLLSYAYPYKSRLALGLLSLVLSGMITVTAPQMIRFMLDAAFVERSRSKLDFYLLVLFGLYTLQAGFSFLRAYYLSLVGERVVADLRRQLYNHLLCLPQQFFAEKRVGELTSRLSSDVTVIQTVASSSVVEMFRQLLLFVGSVIIISITNPRLTLVMLSIMPIMILSAVFFGRYLRRVSTRVQDALAAANGVLDESLAGIRIVQSFVREKFESERYASSIENAFRLAVKRALMTGGFIAFVVFVIFTGVAVVFWYGARLVIEDQMSAGQMTAFILYTVTVAFSIAGIAEVYSQFQQARGATRRVFELLDLAPEIRDCDDALPLKEVRGQVEIDRVSFAYPGRSEDSVLKDVTVSAQPGEVVALVGPSGAGKSTLVSLIPRFYDVASGAIRVDGTDIRSLRIADLRCAIGIVPQETVLFSGSVRDNILYGKLEASDKEIEEAAHAANAHDFIMELPDGYKTAVGERGVKLSGGQRQRIAIARALLKDPAILILDEATSSLDSESERLVQTALERLMQGRTTFVIAHRLSTVRRADRIVVVDGGRVVAEGKHEELMEREGLYKRLCELQFHAVPVFVEEN